MSMHRAALLALAVFSACRPKDAAPPPPPSPPAATVLPSPERASTEMAAKMGALSKEGTPRVREAMVEDTITYKVVPGPRGYLRLSVARSGSVLLEVTSSFLSGGAEVGRYEGVLDETLVERLFDAITPAKLQAVQVKGPRPPGGVTYISFESNTDKTAVAVSGSQSASTEFWTMVSLLKDAVAEARKQKKVAVLALEFRPFTTTVKTKSKLSGVVSLVNWSASSIRIPRVWTGRRKFGRLWLSAVPDKPQESLAEGENYYNSIKITQSMVRKELPEVAEQDAKYATIAPQGRLELEVEVPVRDFLRSGRYHMASGLALRAAAGFLKGNVNQHSVTLSLRSDEVTVTIE